MKLPQYQKFCDTFDASVDTVFDRNSAWASDDEKTWRKADYEKVRNLIKNDFDEAYKKVDAILTPSTPSSAFKIGEKTNDPVSMYLNDIFTVPVNLAGLPGISIPAGLDKKGYPLGLQIIGKAFDEQTLLNIAYAMEEKINFKNNIKEWWIK